MFTKTFFAKNFDSKYLQLACLFFPDRRHRVRFSRSKNIQFQFNAWIGRWIFVVRLGRAKWMLTKPLRKVIIELMNEYVSGPHYYWNWRIG